MRKVWSLAACLLSSACGDNGELAAADAAVDARADATESDCDPGLEASTVSADAAVMISGAAGFEDQNFSGQDLLIGDQLPSVALYHFPISFGEGSEGPVAYFTAFFTLPPAENSDTCGANCGSCSSVTRSGSVDVFVGRNDWNPDEVTWNARDGGGSWQAPGASGLMDRLLFLGTHDYTANEQLGLEFTIGPIVELGLTGGLTLIVDANESGDDDTLWTKAVIDTSESCGGRAAFGLEYSWANICP